MMEPQGYHIPISQSNEIAATELKNLLAMDAKMVDGIIISVTQDSESADFLTQLQEKRVPLVFSIGFVRGSRLLMLYLTIINGRSMPWST